MSEKILKGKSNVIHKYLKTERLKNETNYKTYKNLFEKLGKKLI